MNKTSIENNREVHQSIITNKDKWFGTNNFANTLAQFYFTQSKDTSKSSFLSHSYNIPIDSLQIFNNRKKFNNPENRVYFQQNSMKIIKNLKEEKRIYPHRVNSIAKLNEIYNDGFRSFEMDLMFDTNGTKDIIVGHNEGDTGVTLDIFLSFVNIDNTDKIWMDFKNLNADNYETVFYKLNTLDEKYQLKTKVLLETGNTDTLIKKFSEAGWKTSYYLPTTRLIKLIAENDPIKLEQSAQIISKQITAQKIRGVSFDNRLYNFVKTYLEPKIQHSINYHIWFGPRLRDPHFLKKLQSLSFYKNKRIQTILCNYESEFSL